MKTELFSQWAIVELFGHNQIAGMVTEQTIAGTGFVRVDVPSSGNREAFTRLFGTSAIYSIIPTTEDIATRFANQNVDRPISPYQLSLPTPRDNEIDEIRTWPEDEN